MPSGYHQALAETEVHRAALQTHEVYTVIKTVADVRVLMESHVFAVWDFMCLLKALQGAVTCVGNLWVPRGDPATRRLVNEIVLGEESDLMPDGECLSHFELYLRAMAQVGADVKPINRFIEGIHAGHLVRIALQDAGAPRGAHDFVLATMDVVQLGKAHAIAAAFALGREDIIPTMFMELVKGLANRDRSLDLFVYYLERHIQLDGEEHSELAKKMLSNLCENDDDKWAESAAVAALALKSRRMLWDSVVAQLSQNREERPQSESVPAQAAAS